MAGILRISELGSQLALHFDDGSRMLAYPTGQGYWLVKSDLYTPPPPPVDPPTDPGGGGGGTTPSTDLYNPWGTRLSVGGDWETHTERTGRGGADYPFAYGTALVAAAAGNLQSHETGAGTSDTDTGSVGSAGLRSILYLDTPASRKQPPGTNESGGDLYAIVYQHQSQMQPDGHYNKGDVVGHSGNSGNNVTHFHVHGLDSHGARVDFLKFF